MALSLFCPGKTFLLGEYLALHGGGVFVFATEPYFELQVENGRGDAQGIHPASPTGLLIQEHFDFFKNFNLRFIDGYQGKGGFGASTAQYLTCFSLLAWQKALLRGTESYMDLKVLLENYHRHAWRGEGPKPSGADLVGQWQGGLTYYHRLQGVVQTMAWPQDQHLLLVHTGKKMATHEHLKNLPNIDTSEFAKISSRALDSLQARRFADFTETLGDYQKQLQNLNLTAPHSLELIDQLKQLPGVRVAKACGAMGVDVVLAVVEPSESEQIRAQLKQWGYDFVLTHQQIGRGLHWQVRGEIEIQIMDGENND